MNKKGFKVKLLSRALLIIGIIAFNAAVSTGSDKASSHREYTSSGNYFRCTIPDGWSVHAPSGFGLSEDEKKVYGAVFSGPYVEGQAAPEISVRYYAPGNLLEKTMDKFIRGHSVSFMSEGKPYGEVRQIEFVGRKAKIFESISHRNLSGRDIHPAIVAIYQKFIVIPARKGEGFYALRLSVPFEIKNAYLGTFEELSKSFLPGD